MKKFIFSVLSAFAIFISIYLLFVFPFDILNSWKGRESYNYTYTFVSTLIIFIIVRIYFSSKITFMPLRILVCEGIGIGFISLNLVCLIILSDLFLIIDGTTKINLFLISLAALLIIAYCSTSFIKIRTIRIRSDKVQKERNIVFISDIHLGSNSINHLKKIINKINFIKPEIILIGGDLIDSSSFKLEKLNILEEIKVPIYYVTGNHEYYLKNSKEKIDKLKEFNINVLDNSSKDLEDINLVGISDNLNIEAQKEIFYSKKIKKAFNLCLVHKPSLWKSIKDECDLMLSGHTHNGQIFPFNFLVSIQFKEKYGLYNFKRSYLYVSSGSGTWGPKLRLGSFNEVVSILISP